MALKSLFAIFAVCAFATEGRMSTASGIPLDAAWKNKIYDYAQKNVVHPAWGIAHSERGYRTAQSLAKKEGFAIDEDVLFVAAFLHDIGGIAPFDKNGVDHATRSVEVIEPLLPAWGFPMEKWPQVRELILGHIYYGPAPKSLSAQAFRDADILDFLGSVGVARILAVTEEPGRASPTLRPSVETLKNFAESLPAKCSLRSCFELAKSRKAEMLRFIGELENESLGGTVL